MKKLESPGALAPVLAELRHDADYIAERLALEITEELTKRMQERGMTQLALANRLGVSPAFISRIFNASPNLTLRTIARLSTALDAKPSLHLAATPRKRQRRSS